MIQIVMQNDQELATQNQNKLETIGNLAKEKAVELHEKMRNDLNQI